MKLRNKRTGKIVELEKILFKNTQTEDLVKWKTYEPNVNSLAELNEDWEDYKPAEPQIKDRYPREAVRNWAEVVGGKDDISVTVGYDRTTFENKYGAKIIFTQVLDFTDEEFYEPKVLHRSITELCGGEQE